MTALTIYPDKNSQKPGVATSDPAEIGKLLNKVSVRFERWKADQELKPSATLEEALAAYTTEVDRLSTEAGYQTIDVIRITPDNPKKGELRFKLTRSTRMTRTRCASSWKAAARSACISTTRSTRSPARATIFCPCRPQGNRI